MSAAAQLPIPPEAPPIAPWKKLAVIAGCILGVVLLAWLLSARNITWRSAPKPEPLHVSQNPVTPRLERLPAEAAVPAKQLPAVAAASVPGTQAQATDARQKALASALTVIGTTARAAAVPPKPAADEDGTSGSGSDALEASLKPSTIDGVDVAEMPNPTYTIAAGRVLPCNTQTMLDTTLPGGLTVTIPKEILSDTGDLVVMPAGATVTGTVQHALINGLDRVGVLLQKMRTPILYDRAGLPRRFTVNINSPIAGDLGQTGTDGYVDRHLGKKIGGIFGLAVIQTALQAGASYAQNSGGSRNNSPTFNFNGMSNSGESAANELLRQWLMIPDVLTKLQGKSCGIYMIRDVNMRKAFEVVRNYRTVP